MTRHCPALLALVGAIACGAPGDRVGSRPGAIVEGEASPEGPEDAVLVLRATANDDATLCSATLIAPNLAITAHHCVAPMAPGAFLCALDGALESVDLGAGTLGPEYPPETLEFYGGPPPRSTPLAIGARVLSTLSSNICMNDLALVVLDRALEGPIAPLRLEPAAEPGELVTVLGYGADDGDELHERTQPRLKRSGLVIEAVGPDSIQDGAGEVMPRMFSLVGPSVCLGDSGGPALAESDGGLLGVYSTQLGDDCAGAAVENYFVHLPPYERLVLDAFAAAGAEPWHAGSPNPRLTPDGGECAGDAECQSGGCVAERCAAACVDGACAEGFECNPDVGLRGVCEADFGSPPEPGPIDPGASPRENGDSSGCALSRSSRGAGAGALFVAALLAARRKRRATA